MSAFNYCCKAHRLRCLWVSWLRVCYVFQVDFNSYIKQNSSRNRARNLVVILRLDVALGNEYFRFQIWLAFSSLFDLDSIIKIRIFKFCFSFSCLQMCEKATIMVTFRYFTKNSSHHKWNKAWLLLIKMVYTSCRLT